MNFRDSLTNVAKADLYKQLNHSSAKIDGNVCRSFGCCSFIAVQFSERI
jgi:hypothetical protein